MERKEGRRTAVMLSQAARSAALAKAVERPTTRTGRDVVFDMKFIRATITSNTGPRSSPEHHFTSLPPSIYIEDGGREGKDESIHPANEFRR